MCCGQKIIEGATGLATSAANKLGAHIDEAPSEIVKFRRNICRHCEHAKKNPLFNDRIAKDGSISKGLTSLSQCAVCSCLIKTKTALASQECPLKKWTATNPK